MIESAGDGTGSKPNSHRQRRERWARFPLMMLPVFVLTLLVVPAAGHVRPRLHAVAHHVEGPSTPPRSQARCETTTARPG